MKHIHKFKLLFLFILFLSNAILAQEDALKILENGNVGINNTSPTEKLDVNGNIKSSQNIHSNKNITASGNINSNGKLQENGYDLLPKGTIVMWHGTSIPNGWAICNGANGTPDLRGRFVVGVGKSSNGTIDYNPNDSGGKEEVKLTKEEMPIHSHNIRFERNGIFQWYRSFGGLNSDYNEKTVIYIKGKTGSGEKWFIMPDLISLETGKGKSHENRPPYYAIYYIMKL